MGTCQEVIQTFEQVPHVRAHPQFFRLELRVPMGTCSGLYGNSHFVFYLTCTATDPTDSGEQITFVNTGVPLITVSVTALAIILGALIGLWRYKG